MCNIAMSVVFIVLDRLVSRQSLVSRSSRRDWNSRVTRVALLINV